MRNGLISIFDASARRRELGTDAPIAELRRLFSAACRFGLTHDEREEWQARFDKAIAAVEAELAAGGEAVIANAPSNGGHLGVRLITALAARSGKRDMAERAV